MQIVPWKGKFGTKMMMMFYHNIMGCRMQKPVRHIVNAEIMLHSFTGIKEIKCAGASTPTMVRFSTGIQFLVLQKAVKMMAAKI